VILRSFSLCLLAFFLSLKCAFSADIQLTLSHYSVDEQVTVVIENNSLEKVQIDAVYIELAHQKYETASQKVIPPEEKRNFCFKVKNPPFPGSYPLTATIRYFNDGQVLSLRHVGLFHYKASSILDISCFAEDVIMKEEGDIVIRSAQPQLWNLILPEEINIVSVSTFEDSKIFHLKTNVTGLRNKYPFFVVAEMIPI